MFLIILHHLCQHGLRFAPDSELSLNYFVSKCLYVWPGQLGNWLFILLSGYFVSNSEFSLKKIFKLWLQIFTISAAIGLVLYLTKIPLIGFRNHDYAEKGFFAAAKPASVGDLIRSFFPALCGNNWFASAYLLFYMFTPFLNASLKFFDRKTHLKLIILMTVMGTVVKMIFYQGIFHEGNFYYFILGYYVASYIRLYDLKIFQNQKINLFASVAMCAFFVLWIAFTAILGKKIAFVQEHLTTLLYYPAQLSSFPMLFTAVFVFCFFKNLKTQYLPRVNKIAGATFGTYLLHDNLLLNKIIWHRVFKLDDFINSRFLIFYILFATVVTFAVCSAIELLRQKFIEKPTMKLFSPLKKV